MAGEARERFVARSASRVTSETSSGGAKVRKSLPLSATDLQDLESLRSSGKFEGRSDASLMSEVFKRGMRVLREEMLEEGYAEIAKKQEAVQGGRAVARRRRPAWAEEE